MTPRHCGIYTIECLTGSSPPLFLSFDHPKSTPSRFTVDVYTLSVRNCSTRIYVPNGMKSMTYRRDATQLPVEGQKCYLIACVFLKTLTDICYGHFGLLKQVWTFFLGMNLNCLFAGPKTWPMQKRRNSAAAALKGNCSNWCTAC